MTVTRRTDDALCDYERQILALWDSGMPLRAISLATGRTLKAVRTVTENYDDRLDDLDPVRQADIAYVKRLRAVHGALIDLRAAREAS